MANDGADPFPKLGSVYRVSDSKANHMRVNGDNTKLNSGKNSDSRLGPKQSQDNAGGSAPKHWFSWNSGSNAWGNPNAAQKLSKQGNAESAAGTNSTKHVDKSNSAKNAASGGNGSSIIKLLKNSAVASKPDKGPYAYAGLDSTSPNKDFRNGQCKDERIQEPHNHVGSEFSDDENADSDYEIVFDSDDDDVSFDDTDSDTGEKTHEGCKKSKWFRKFFGQMDRLTIEEISSEENSWHCPACEGGVGAIDWYQGLQPLLNHSKTIQSRRAKLHRKFSQILEEECCRRRIPFTTACNNYGRWEGLEKKFKDHEIVWPPVVVIMNTRYEQDDSNKWSGMGSQELLNYFSDYAALKARHAYGPQGHRGMSVLIFEPSTAGYLEAARLHKHFREQGKDREAWDHCQKHSRNLFAPGGKRQLYGYLASREDMDNFNKNSGKQKLKYEMRSYQEMVESQIKHLNDEQQQLGYFKDIAATEQARSQALAQSLSIVGEKLRQAIKENRVVRERTREQHQENKDEMKAQEKFFQEQIQVIEQVIAIKEDNFELFQQLRRAMVKSQTEDDKQRVDDFIKLQDKEMRNFEAERDKLHKIYENKMAALRKKHMEEELEYKKQYQSEVTQLIDIYTTNSHGTVQK